MPLIELSHLCKTYTIGENQVQALDDVSLTVEEHEFVAIIGPSGSGKSTLMNIIGCLDTASSGTYKLNDLEIGEYDDNCAQRPLRSEQTGFSGLLPKSARWRRTSPNFSAERSVLICCCIFRCSPPGF